MNNKIAVESLSMDLLRIANGLHKGSYKMAKRFSNEALARCREINKKEVRPYFVRTLNNISLCLSNQPSERTAEDALMYSVLCRNYARKYMS